MQTKFAKNRINKHHNNLDLHKAMNCIANVNGSRHWCHVHHS